MAKTKKSGRKAKMARPASDQTQSTSFVEEQEVPATHNVNETTPQNLLANPNILPLIGTTENELVLSELLKRTGDAKEDSSEIYTPASEDDVKSVMRSLNGQTPGPVPIIFNIKYEIKNEIKTESHFSNTGIIKISDGDLNVEVQGAGSQVPADIRKLAEELSKEMLDAKDARNQQLKAELAKANQEKEVMQHAFQHYAAITRSYQHVQIFIISRQLREYMETSVQFKMFLNMHAITSFNLWKHFRKAVCKRTPLFKLREEMLDWWGQFIPKRKADYLDSWNKTLDKLFACPWNNPKRLLRADFDADIQQSCQTAIATYSSSSQIVLVAGSLFIQSNQDASSHFVRVAETVEEPRNTAAHSINAHTLRRLVDEIFLNPAARELLGNGFDNIWLDSNHERIFWTAAKKLFPFMLFGEEGRSIDWRMFREEELELIYYHNPVAEPFAESS